MCVRVSGIIPARAGFTSTDTFTTAQSSDHPRSRGVYWSHVAPHILRWGSSPLARGLRGPVLGWFERVGSSPLARGLRWPCVGLVRTGGIIPARAGFTFLLFFLFVWLWDHPRSRGVYRVSSSSQPQSTGSSPLARGLLGLKRAYKSRVRIIPARAGFTHRPPWSGQHSSDHPRSRGVYTGLPEELRVVLGSSPLARGLLVDPFARPLPFGIIPARAGFTSESPIPHVLNTDHPRSRGVYFWLVAAQVDELGSSPLARGLRTKYDPRKSERRIIPARAGFTDSMLWRWTPERDHPRSRGVYPEGFKQSIRGIGSSPLARGLRIDVDQLGLIPRIIPARAGFTR